MILLDMGFTRNYSLVIYIPLLIAGGIALAFFLINIIIRIFQSSFHKKVNDPNRPTTVQDINYVTQILHLTNEEKNFLQELCKDNKCPNFIMFMRNQAKIDALFKTIIHTIEDERKKAILYSIRTKIEQDPQNTSFITSTKNILEGQRLMYNDENVEHHPSTVLKNTKEGLIVQVPKNIYGDEIKPKPLSKINFSFETKNLIAYTFQTRIVRYQNTQENEMVISHTNNLEVLVRRNQKRIPYKPQCVFSAVKVSSGGLGKNPKVSYEALPKKHEGTLMDISANGCSLQTNMPISKGQYIYIEFRMDAEAIEKAFGKIVNATTTQTKLTILHIEFVKISLETRNKIYKKVYDYV